jgi:spore coat protein U-like protein
VVSAEALSRTNVSLPVIDSPFLSGQDGYLSLVLDHDSLTDITDQVSEDGQLSVTFSASSAGAVRHRLFAYYQKRTLHKNLEFHNNATTTIWDNGSYAVDHYSARGAQTVIDFWEKYILVDGIKELVMEAGNYGTLLSSPVDNLSC